MTSRCSGEGALFRRLPDILEPLDLEIAARTSSLVVAIVDI
jgi:hypothetical protein